MTRGRGSRRSRMLCGVLSIVGVLLLAVGSAYADDRLGIGHWTGSDQPQGDRPPPLPALTIAQADQPADGTNGSLDMTAVGASQGWDGINILGATAASILVAATIPLGIAADASERNWEKTGFAGGAAIAGIGGIAIWGLTLWNLYGRRQSATAPRYRLLGLPPAVADFGEVERGAARNVTGLKGADRLAPIVAAGPSGAYVGVRWSFD